MTRDDFFLWIRGIQINWIELNWTEKCPYLGITFMSFSLSEQRDWNNFSLWKHVFHTWRWVCGLWERLTHNWSLKSSVVGSGCAGAVLVDMSLQHLTEIDGSASGLSDWESASPCHEGGSEGVLLSNPGQVYAGLLDNTDWLIIKSQIQGEQCGR